MPGKSGILVKGICSSWYVCGFVRGKVRKGCSVQENVLSHAIPLLLRVGKSHESVWVRLLSFLRVRKASLKAASPFSFQIWYISRRKATCRGKTLF